MAYNSRKKPPQGKLVGTFDELKATNCIQAETENLRERFGPLMILTRYNPCDGCPEWENRGAGCAGYKSYHTEARNKQRTKAAEIVAATEPNNVPKGHQYAGKSMKEIAAILGISLNQTRKLKREGKL